MSPSDHSTGGPSIIQRPALVAEPPQRCDTAFSETPTLVRTNSNRSRSSIAKAPLPEEGSSATAPVRSIFPEYNPEIPLSHQNYYPTQTSPTHIPASAISRRLYSPTVLEQEEAMRQEEVLNEPVRSPMSAGSSRTQNTQANTRKWPPPRINIKPSVPNPSTTEQLKGFWKVANGWKASASEGRVYCMKMTAEKDTPIYTLSSATQPVYSLRLDPTSASAYVTLQRYDPSKPFKGPTVPPASSTLSEAAVRPDTSKAWQEVMTTTLEAESRRHPPEDGLVALLYPSAAAKMALDRPSDTTAVLTAERECGRLVWDDDTGNHYLVHPALAMPFCVTVERNPTWSRTEYTLEHIESPQHIARLTRDGTGTGWLEVDTGIAAKIDAVYLVDVAITALMLVAHGDGAFKHVEVFEPPPVFGSPPGSARSSSKRNSSRMSIRQAEKKEKKAAKNGGKNKTHMEEFELDLESQVSDLKKLDVKDKDKLPGLARAVIKVLSVVFKCFIWCATMFFRAFLKVIALMAKCVTSEKL